MIKRLLKASPLVAMVALFCLSSCSKKEVLAPSSTERVGQIQFTVGENSRGGLSVKGSMGVKGTLAAAPASVLANATSIAISYADAAGNTYNVTSTLRGFNGSYISDPISMKAGVYSLNQFNVINDNATSANNVIAATPARGTTAAAYVQRPLSQTLTVNGDVTSNTTMEVVSVAGLTPQDFGYQSFRLNEIKLFGFLLNVQAYDVSIDNSQGGYNAITGVSVSISRAGSILNNTITTRTTTVFSLPYGSENGSDLMTLVLTKSGYATKTITKTVAELSDYFEPRNGGKGALVVVLETSINYLVSTFAGTGVVGSNNGVRSTATFNYPYGLVVNQQGVIYIAETGSNLIRSIDNLGNVSTLVGDGSTSIFNAPRGIAIDNLGNLYVADKENNRIQRITANGTLNTFAGGGVAGFVNGSVNSAQFNKPHAVAVDLQGNVYVADTDNHCIRRISNGVVSTFAGGSGVGLVNGSANSAQFNSPAGIAVDAQGNVYVTDANCIRKISNGVVTTFAGSSEAGLVDGFANNAKFNNIIGIAVDAQGNVYVTDMNNHCIRKIANGVVTTIAGNGVAGYADGIGNLTQFKYPSSIAVDVNGNIYVSDTHNLRIRKLQLQ